MGLDASFVEATLHFHNIGKDLPKKCVCTHHGEKGNGFRLSFAQEVVGETSHSCQFRSTEGSRPF